MLILTVNWTNAFIVTFLGITLVFIVLCLLIGLLQIFGMLVKLSERKKVTPDKKEKEHPAVISGAENAAIAMSLYLYHADVHDEESDIITIKSINRRYSPWNVKTY